MNWLARFLIGTALWCGLFAFGWYVLGIHPTFTEVLFLVLVTSICNGAEEGLK